MSFTADERAAQVAAVRELVDDGFVPVIEWVLWVRDGSVSAECLLLFRTPCDVHYRQTDSVLCEAGNLISVYWLGIKPLPDDNRSFTFRGSVEQPEFRERQRQVAAELFAPLGLTESEVEVLADYINAAD